MRVQRTALEAFIGVEMDKVGSETPAGVAKGALSGQEREAAAGLLEQIAADLTELAAILRSDRK